MFETSYFDILQDYIAGGCKEELSPQEEEYYNALYAIIGIGRKYGKDKAIAFLTHKPFCVPQRRARQMYDEAINLFFADDNIENSAHRNLLYDNLTKMAAVVSQNVRSSKDAEVYGNLMIQAWKVKQLDRVDPPKLEEVKEKPIKIYSLKTETVGLPSIDRQELAAQIDAIIDIPERERERIKRDAQVTDIDFVEMLDDTQNKTKDIK
ncbi:hypothetical protein EZS27_031410 [termite gut metagenome]|uniref:Uncharacterized protein n=1 Tax=termite gut metagenome TaxID=433724 RepID=A0A5J4QAV1_9ZZZZ